MHIHSLHRLLPMALLLLVSSASEAFGQTALYGITSAGVLIRINTTTGAPTVVGSPGVANPIGLANRGGQMYVWLGALQNRIVEINPLTGSTVNTINFVTAGGYNEGDLAFRSDGIGFVSDVTTAQQIHRIDISMPAAPVSTPIGFANLNAGVDRKTLDGMAFDAGDILYGISESSGLIGTTFGAPEPTTRLYTVDPLNGNLTLVGDTLITGTTSGGLTFDAVGTLYMSVYDPAGGSRLYTLDKVTAVPTLIGSIAGHQVVGIAFGPAPVGGPGVTIVESGGSTNITEGGTTDDYTVVLNTAPTGPVTITITPGTNASVVPATLTFTPANWNIAQTVTVTALDDALIEGAHTGTITHASTSADAAYNGAVIANVVANITDNDGPVVIPPVGGGGINEGNYPGSLGLSNGAGGEGTFGFGRSTGRSSLRQSVLTAPTRDPIGTVRVFNLGQPHQSNTTAGSGALALVGWTLLSALAVAIPATIAIKYCFS